MISLLWIVSLGLVVTAGAGTVVAYEVCRRYVLGKDAGPWAVAMKALRQSWKQATVVGLLAEPPTGLVAQESEVEAILEVPLSALLHPDAFREERWGSLEIDHPIAFFEIEGDTIWGATGAMLHQFLRTVLPPASRS